MLDDKAYPADEIRALYHERWEIELGFDEVKTHLLEREETIRSKKPKGVMQEIWAIGRAYNLVRLEMERIAEEAGLPPSRISFVASLCLIRDEWMGAATTPAAGTLPRKLLRLREQSPSLRPAAQTKRAQLPSRSEAQDERLRAQEAGPAPQNKPRSA